MFFFLPKISILTSNKQLIRQLTQNKEKTKEKYNGTTTTQKYETLIYYGQDHLSKSYIHRVTPQRCYNNNIVPKSLINNNNLALALVRHVLDFVILFSLLLYCIIAASVAASE